MAAMRVAPLLLLVGAASAGEIRLVDVPPTPEKPAPKWLSSFEEAEALAQREKRALFLYFTANW